MTQRNGNVRTHINISEWRRGDQHKTNILHGHTLGLQPLSVGINEVRVTTSQKVKLAVNVLPFP